MTTLRTWLLLAAAALGSTAIAPAASASVSIGDTVTCSYSNLCSSYDETVKNGAEYEADGLRFDFSTDLLTISSTLPRGILKLPGYGARRLTFQNDTVNFTSATLLASTFHGLDQSVISVTANGLVLDLHDVVNTFGVVATISLGASTAPAVAAVPEPATWAMMLLGFGMIGAAARRRRLTLASC